MKPVVRQWKATWRDTIILLNEFRAPLILFTVAVVGGGLAHAAIADLVGEPVQSLSEAIYIVLTAAFPPAVGQRLYRMGESVVVVEIKLGTHTTNAAREMGIPVIQADARHAGALEGANIKDAKTIILASQEDAMNLQIALKARTLNPKIQVVIRIFDEDFAHALQEQFGFTALSATEMAAPVFAAAAAGADGTHPSSLEGQQLSLARMTIPASSRLADKTVGYVEANYHLNIILLRHDHQSEMHPTDTRPLHTGDTLAVLGGPEQLSR